MGQAAPVVVGLTASPRSAEAVRWAARVSRQTLTPMVLVHAYAPDPELVQRPDGRRVLEGLVRSQATQWIRDALVGCSLSPWRSRLVVVEGQVLESLLDHAGGAGLLVLGSPHPATTEDPRTSVVSQCEAHATCPVVVIPPAAAPARAPSERTSGPTEAVGQEPYPTR